MARSASVVLTPAEKKAASKELKVLIKGMKTDQKAAEKAHAAAVKAFEKSSAAAAKELAKAEAKLEALAG